VAEVEHFTAGGIALRLGAVLLLVFANAFMVAAEFALVASRRSRIDQMVANGDRAARNVQRALDHLDRYISGTQLGITLASLGLGWIGEPALAALLDAVFLRLGVEVSAGATHTAAAITTAFLIITFLHIVLGELAPKSLALVAPERISRWIARPLMVFSAVMSPAIWVLNGAANWLLRLFGVANVSESSRVHSPEEIRLLVVQARAHGTLDESDSAMLAGVFDFHNKRARDVMRPRTEVVAVDMESSEQELRELIQRERYSRYPVIRESLDDVVGVLLAKDFWLRDAGDPFDIQALLRDPLYIPATLPAELALDRLRKTRAHMAVVLDEYGGTEGILTVEDLVEEVIGDIADEYDVQSRTSIETDGVLELAGSLSLVDVRSDYNIPIPDGEWTTLGGYAFSRIGRLPHVGDRAPYPGGELEVVAMDGRRVAALRVHRNGSTGGRAA
jgi:CBS domain containing-hemolysin-like protein